MKVPDDFIDLPDVPVSNPKGLQFCKALKSGLEQMFTTSTCFSPE